MAEYDILLIDKEESTCDLVKTVLSTRGFQVTVASTVQVALDSIRENTYSLLIIDITISDFDPRSIIREMKRLDENIAVIITSYADNRDLVMECLNLNANDFLYKPINPGEAYLKARHSIDFRKLTVNKIKVLKGIEERNISLQKQNILLVKRIDESTKNLSKLYEDLRETYMRTIKALAHAIDARDHYTFSHSDNVTRYAEIIARQMKIDAAYMEDLRDACQLHDLGKIGIHDSVLSKPGALTNQEFNEIKLHAQKGAQILEPLNFMDNVIEIVKHHHERFDGKGYPYGLKGEEIPLGSRIMSVADSYDAMVSARPYRKVGLTKNEAVSEIKKNRDTQFDPIVVDAFLEVIDQL